MSNAALLLGAFGVIVILGAQLGFTGSKTGLKLWAFGAALLVLASFVS